MTLYLIIVNLPGVLISPKTFKLSKPPFLLLGLDKVEFVDRVKYLGIIMDSSSNDNCDISRQTRALYCIGNKLRSKFSLYSTYVKNILFKSYCMSLYVSSLWHNYQRWSPRGRPWPRGRTRGHILKSLALASKP